MNTTAINTNVTQFNEGNANIAARLIERKKRIIDANMDAISGKTIVDLAANNGRWSYAAIEAGANKVTSIEGRPERVVEAKNLFAELGVSEKIETHCGDMYDWLFTNSALRPDTVFCLGIYYHIMDHYYLLKQMAKLKPQTIIIDSGFVRSFRNSVHIQMEDPNLHLNALKVHDAQSTELVGFVSLGLMIQMSWNLGYSCRPVVWDPEQIQEPNSVHDYLLGRRYTVRLEKTDSFVDDKWKSYWAKALKVLNPEFESLMEKESHDFRTDDRARHPLKNSEFSIM